MKVKLRCLICGGEHNNDSRHFPLVSHKKVKNKEGKIEDRIVGYICLKCCRKEIKKERRENVK